MVVLGLVPARTGVIAVTVAIISLVAVVHVTIALIPIALVIVALVAIPLISTSIVPLAPVVPNILTTVTATLVATGIALVSISLAIVAIALVPIVIPIPIPISTSTSIIHSSIPSNRSPKRKALILRAIRTSRNINPLRLARQALLLSILRHQTQRPSLAIERKQLRVGNLSTTIGSPTARKQVNLIPSLASRIKVQACLREGAHNESLALLVVVLARGDDVPALAVRGTARSDLHGRKIGSEVAGELVHEEAFSVCRLDLHVGKGSCGGVVTLVSFFGGSLVEFGDGATSRHRDSQTG